MAATGDVRIGFAGWTYPPWRGVFYPEGWVQKRELEYAATKVRSIEINGTFYSLQRAESFRKWAAAVPEGFMFSVKGPQYITHIRRLKDVGEPLANLYASGVLELGAKLGPVLWQFPPNFKFAPELVEDFFKLLPRTAREGAKLARKHGPRIKGKVNSPEDADMPLRHAMEVRNNSFANEEFVALLRKNDVALVVADTAGKWPYMEDVTSDFVYARLHGDEELYASGYTDKALDEWARRIKAWAGGGEIADAKLTGPKAKARKSGRDVYVYFDNDVKVHAPFDAMKLAGIV